MGKLRGIPALIVLCAVLALASTVAPAAAQDATLYQALDYSGASFSAGGDVSFVGWEWNDQITSLTVPPGGSVTIYEHADFGGASLTLSSDTADLRWFSGPGGDGTWNDAVSSLRVSGGPPPPPPPSRTVVLVNGSFNPNPPWMEPNAPEYQAIASTYGVQPVQFRWTDSDFAGVNFPFYSGIWNGASALAGFINALPPGEIEVVTHSHGGNVAILATGFYTNRQVTRLISLAAPVNWDLRWNGGLRVDWMCTASSHEDWVQFIGSSPYQVYRFADAAYDSFSYARQSTIAFIEGRYEDALYYAALATYYFAAGHDWWHTTKEEWWGWTIMFGGGAHGDMHEPPVWNALPLACKRP